MTYEVVFFRLGLFLISVFALLDELADVYIGFWCFFFLKKKILDWVCFTICCLGLMLGFFSQGGLALLHFFFRF